MRKEEGNSRKIELSHAKEGEGDACFRQQKK
jgi:hypothetical protein